MFHISDLALLCGHLVGLYSPSTLIWTSQNRVKDVILQEITEVNDRMWLTHSSSKNKENSYRSLWQGLVRQQYQTAGIRINSCTAMHSKTSRMIPAQTLNGLASHALPVDDSPSCWMNYYRLVIDGRPPNNNAITDSEHYIGRRNLEDISTKSPLRTALNTKWRAR